MLIRSQDKCILVTLENGVISENASEVYFTDYRGKVWEMGRYNDIGHSDRTKTQKVIDQIILAKEQECVCFNMPPQE